MVAKGTSSQSNPNDARIGQISRTLDQYKEELEEVNEKLRCRSKEFLKLAKVIDPDTGGFGPETTTTRFFKRVCEQPPRVREYSIPSDVGDLVFWAMTLGRKIEQGEKEMKDLKS